MGGRRQSLPIIYVVTIYRSKCEQVRDSVPLVAPTIHVLMRVLQMPLRFHSLHASLMINGYNLKVIWMELSYFSQFCDITTLKINYLFALISFLMKQLIYFFSAFFAIITDVQLLLYYATRISMFIIISIYQNNLS